MNILGVALLSEFCYCPRSFAYRLIEFKPLEEDNYYIVDGRSAVSNDYFETRDRRGNSQFNRVYISHPTLPISGVIDRIVYDNGIYHIVEEKRGGIRENEQHIFQLKLYAWLYQLQYADRKLRLSLYYTKSRRHIDVDWGEQCMNSIESYAFSIIRLLDSFSLDSFKGVLDHRCIGCMYQDLCGG